MQQLLPVSPIARPCSGRTRWHHLLALLALLVTGGRAAAQTIKTLPGDYASFSAAITDINTNFPAGGVTVNVAAGYLETAPAGGLPLLTAQGTGGAAGQIIFQKSGSGANPLIQAGVGTLTPTTLTAPADGIVRLSGADYVTFNGIDLSDANTSQAAAAEFGYSFFRPSATNGCQNNTLQNCTVTLNRSGSASNGLSYGVYLALTDATGTAVTPTSAAGSNSGNRFYTNTIVNTQSGAYVVGYNAASPYTLADQNNDFGGTATGTGNTVRNFGGVAGVTAFGIYGLYQQAYNASYNTVDNTGSGGTATAIFGVYASGGGSGNLTLNNNTVTLTQLPTGTSTTANQATAVYGGHTGTGTASLSNNTVSYTLAGTGTTTSANNRFMVLAGNGSTAIGALSMNGNQVTYNLSSAATAIVSGAAYGVNCQGAVTGNASLSNNTVAYTVSNASTTAASMATSDYAVAVNGGYTTGGNMTLTGNITGHSLTLSSTGTTTGAQIGLINFSPVTGNLVVTGNTETHAYTSSETTFSGALYGVSNQAAGAVTGTTTITGNTVNYGSTSSPLSTTAGTVSGSLLGITNSAPLTGAATISANTITYVATRSGGTLSSAFTGFSSSGATASTLLLDSNTLLGSSTASTGAMTIVAATGTSTGLLTISNNKYQNGTTGSTGQIYFINANSATLNITAQGNQFTGFTKNGTSTAVVYGYYNFGAPTAAGTQTITGNTITGINLLGGSGAFTSPFAGIFSSTNTTITHVITNNVVGSLATGGGISTGASLLTGMYAAGYGANNANIAGNTIQNLSGGSTVVGITTTNSSTSPISAASSLLGGTITGNTIQSLSTSGAAGVYGMYLATNASATAALVTSGNKISDLNANGAGASTAYGLYTALGLTHTLQNNVVGNLAATASTSSPAVVGLYLNAGTTLNAYYNTVYLTGTGGTNFGAAGIAFTGTPTTITLNNNLVVNNATATGTGISTALGRVAAGTAGTVPANLNTATNNNLLYAASPGYLYAEGTTTSTVVNGKTTLFDYRNFMYLAPGSTNSSTTREQRAVSQNVTFASTTGTDANFLKPDATVPTPVESGAQPISGITLDYAGTTRNTSTPDIGAYEGNYTYVDVVAPGIQYTPLTNTAVTTNRAFTNVAVVDVAPGSGVNGTSGTRPRVYYKLSTDANAYNDNTNGTPGWKYVEASGSTSPFSFTIDYSLLPSTPVVGTTIQYFVVAQDGAATPNVAIDAGTFAAQPASVALTGAAFPIGGTLNQYQITNPLPTTISVGTGQTYTSLTNSGGLFDAINNGALGGNTTVTITSDLSAETGTVALGPLPDNGNGYTLTVQSDGTLRNITNGAATTNAAGLIRLAGASRVVFDGQQPSGSKNLLFGTTTANVPTFNLTADASNDKLTWLLVESANTGASSGTIVVGSGTTTGSKLNEFTANDIRSTANTTTATYANGLYSAGVSSAVPNGPGYAYYNNIHNFSNSAVFLDGSNNANWVVAGNYLYQEAARTASLYAVQVAGGNNHQVANNNIYQTAGTVATLYGIDIYGGTGHTVTGNSVGGSSGGAGGSALTATGTVVGIFVNPSTGGTATTVQGNTVRAITNTGAATTTYGIYNSAGTVLIGGTGSGQGNTIGGTGSGQGVTVAYTGIGIFVSNPVAATVTGNQVLSLQTSAGLTTGAYLYGLYAAGAGAHIFTNNTVTGVVNSSVPTNSRNAQTTGLFAVATGAVTVAGNQLNNIGNTATTTGTTYYHFVAGLYVSGTGSGSQVLRNRVYNVYTSTATAGSPADVLIGLYSGGTSNTVANNQVALATATSAAPALYGFYEAGTGNMDAFNSVYLAGSGSGDTYAFYRSTTGATTIRNNLSYNARTGAGNNYAIVSATGGFVGSTSNPATNTSDYNLFFASDATKVGLYNSTGYSFAGWKTATGGDGSSMSETSATVPAASLFTSTSTGDLSLIAANSAAWYANGTGTQLPAIGTDYTGTTARSTTVAAGAPDIGSTEVTPSSIPPAMTASPAAPVLGGTQTFTLGGRQLASFAYGSTLSPLQAGPTTTSGRTTASALPSQVVGRYYSGTNPPGPFAAGARYANAYFSFVDANGDGSGYTYVPTLTYDPASLGTIASESAQQVSLRNADNSGYDTYPSTVTPAPTRTVASNLALSRLGLTALSDAAAPLPVQLVKFDATRQGTDALLSWTTASELDNKGFEVQVSPDGQKYHALGFVAGAGSSSNLRNYSFVDQEAGKAGLRYYRLNQLDLSGKSTYSPVRTLTFEVAGLLVQAAPNPFAGNLTLSLSLPAASTTPTELLLTDALGRTVLHQALGALPAGTTQADLAGVSQLPAGVYLLRVTVGGESRTLKVVRE